MFYSTLDDDRAIDFGVGAEIGRDRTPAAQIRMRIAVLADEIHHRNVLDSLIGRRRQQLDIERVHRLPLEIVENIRGGLHLLEKNDDEPAVPDVVYKKGKAAVKDS